jgi:hypothetical protein
MLNHRMYNNESFETSANSIDNQEEQNNRRRERISEK